MFRIEDHPILASLRDFVRAGLRPKTPLAKAIVLALCLKLIVIVSMRVFLFSGEARPFVDEGVVSRLIVSAPVDLQSRKDLR